MTDNSKESAPHDAQPTKAVCAGYPTCDGDLVGEPHSADCPAAQPTPERDELWAALTVRKDSGIPDAVLLAIAEERFAALERSRNRLLAERAGIVEMCAKVCDDREAMLTAMLTRANARSAGDSARQLSAQAMEVRQCATAIRSLAPAESQATAGNEDVWKIAGYEYLRRMNPREFTEFWTECLYSTESFDSKVKQRIYAARAQGRGDE